MGAAAAGVLTILAIGVVLLLVLRRKKAVPTAQASPEVLAIFACLHCGKKLKARAAQAGGRVKCPGCGKATPVPE